MRHTKSAIATVALLAAAASHGVALADPAHQPDYSGSLAALIHPGLADPAGIRSALAARGIEVSGAYTADVFGNVSGGLEQGTHYLGLSATALDIDFEKLTGWRGLTFHADVFQIHGTSISGENLGSLVAVTNAEAYPSMRLFELWFEQKLFQDRLAIKFGQVAADTEFFLADGGGNFVNSTFGWTAISSDNIPVGGPIYPIATPGVRVAYEPNDRLKLMAGVWNGDPVGPCPDNLDPGQCNRHGLDFRLGDSALAIAEAGYSYGKASLPGTIRVGGWRHFGDFDDLRRDENGGLLAVSGGDQLQHRGNHGIYAVLDQMIYRLPGYADPKGISVFGRVAFSPEDRNQIDSYYEAGIVFTGFIPSRPDDVIAAAFGYVGISDRAAAFDGDSGLAVTRDYEAVLEISYQTEVVPGLTLQPDFQYIWNPGGHVPDDNGQGQRCGRVRSPRRRDVLAFQASPRQTGASQAPENPKG